MKISGAIFIIIGLAVAVTSYFLNQIDNKNRFILFMVIGIGLFVYGVGKLIFRKKENVEMHENHLHQGKHRPNTTAAQPQMQDRQAAQNIKYNFCPYCGTIIRQAANFCPTCGTRLR